MRRCAAAMILGALSCQAEFEGDERDECGDDADNDRDGLFDCDDPGCAGAAACDAAPAIDTDPADTVPAEDAEIDDSEVAADTELPPGPSPLDIDDDLDGYTENDGDCDDDNPEINPVAKEVLCDGEDTDCDGLIDDGALCLTTVQHNPDPASASYQHAYLIGSDHANYRDIVRTACQDYGYDLVSVDDAAEWLWLEQRIAAASDASGTTHYWIGLECIIAPCNRSAPWFYLDGSIGFFDWYADLSNPNNESSTCGRAFVEGDEVYMRPYNCDAYAGLVCEAQ